MASGDPATLMQEEAARVRVLNGTTTEDLPERTGNYLRAQGMQAVEVGGNAGKRYSRTTVVMYGSKLYTLRYLIDKFGITATSQILFTPDVASDVDIEIRVGTDALSLIP